MKERKERCIQKSRMLWTAVLLAVLVFQMPRQSRAVTESPLAKSACEIFQHPKSFDDKLVQVAGDIQSDGIERSMVTDIACSGAGIAISYSSKASNSANVRRLRNAIFFTGQPGTHGNKISATLIGHFKWNPKTNLREIVVDKVEKLSVSD